MENRGKAGKLDFLLRNSFKSSFTFIMLAVAFLLYAFDGSKARELCLYAVFASTIADLFMMNYQNIPSMICRNKHFYIGTVFFAVAHILYHLTFLEVLSENVSEVSNFNNIIFLFISVCLLLIVFCVLLKEKAIFRRAVLVYLACMCLNFVSIANCAAEIGGRYYLALLGIIFFFISDGFILIREIKKDNSFVRKAIWIFYPLAQLLIIFSI